MQMRERVKIQFPDISDGILARQTLDGDQQAFETLMKRYHAPLYNFICRFLNDYDSACDILQQVFLQLYISLSTLHTDKAGALGSGTPDLADLHRVSGITRSVGLLRRLRPPSRTLACSRPLAGQDGGGVPQFRWEM